MDRQREGSGATVKKPKVRSCLLRQRYGYQLLFSCLEGLYSCRWRRYPGKVVKPGEWCCSQRECVFYPVLAAAFFTSLFFLYLWRASQNDYNNFDWYSYTNLGVWFLWSLAILFMTTLAFSYVFLLLILALCLVSDGQRLYLHYYHKVGTVVVLIFAVTVFAVVTILWNQQWKTVMMSMQITAPFMHVIALLFMILLSWPVALYTFRLGKPGMYSPCIMEEGTLGPKPVLIGHRGAPMVAPENTLMSFVKTIEHGGGGFETDVQISLDGVPFLMHDTTLLRTTNIREVKPEEAEDDAAMFTWDVLRRLDAGSWFFKNKPFANMPAMSWGDRMWVEEQNVYQLRDLLRLADRDDQMVIFDLNRPPLVHPYSEEWIDRTLEVILNESHIRHHLILWMENIDRSRVCELAPGFQQTYNRKAPVSVLLREKIVKLNLDYREMSPEDIRMYARHNITSNFYVVSEPWLFSLAWCAGAHSVTTNAVHSLSYLKKPEFLMTPRDYRIMWICTDVFSGILIFLVFFFHWRKEKLASTVSGRSADELTSYNTSYSTFGSDSSPVPEMPTVG
ncbi:glycerophosphodiester phosphodiesterase domain-containing protein 4 isoform X2 [Paroedura picta]|uniref:glycerophosphodiester phosphodiesterase domain-containing protein 4 isoform X2 n=1 Tax=Paroedura picta TaxID=143630 RepID=UPI004055A745